MRNVLLCAGALTLAAGCASTPTISRPMRDLGESAMMVPPDGRIELALDEKGRITEIEFHIRPEDLPEAVRAAAERELPGGEVIDAEKEIMGGRVLWEITKRIDGVEREVLFEEDGTPIAWELEIDASRAPQSVLDAADAAAPGMRTKVEEIRGRNRELVAYHIKKEHNGIRYKIELTPEGKVEAVLRETQAEVEVPVKPLGRSR